MKEEVEERLEGGRGGRRRREERGKIDSPAKELRYEHGQSKPEP